MAGATYHRSSMVLIIGPSPSSHRPRPSSGDSAMLAAFRYPRHPLRRITNQVQLFPSPLRDTTNSCARYGDVETSSGSRLAQTSVVRLRSSYISMQRRGKDAPTKSHLVSTAVVSLTAPGTGARGLRVPCSGLSACRLRSRLVRVHDQPPSSAVVCRYETVTSVRGLSSLGNSTS